MEEQLTQEQEYFNLILREYVDKLTQLEHQNILIRIENKQLRAKLKELEPSPE